MEAFLIDPEALRRVFQSAPSGPLTPEQLSQWGQTLGVPLEVVSLVDAHFMLPGDALAGWPKAAAALYGVASILGRAIDGRSIATGYMPPPDARSLLEELPEPDFDDPDPGVLAGREELEGWLRKAVSQNKTLLIVWN